jgi:hypothetical protein
MVARNPELNESNAVKEYLSQIEDAVLSVFNSTGSGFYQHNHQLMLDLPAYGTACMFIDDSKEDISFSTIPLSQVYIDEDFNGAVNTIFRKIELTGRQILNIEKWEKGLDSTARGRFTDSPNKKFEVIHAVMPSKDLEAEIDIEVNTSKEFGSIYFIKSPDIILEVDSFFENPYVTPRWEKLTGEIYGRGSGWNAISDILMLNVMSESGIRSVQLSSAPSFLVPDDGVLTDIRAIPNGVTVGGIDEDGNPRVRELPYNPRLDFLEAEKDTRRDAIRRAFFVDRFEQKPGTPVSATENLDNQQVRLALAAPQLFRIELEYLTPVIDRVYNILVRKNKIPLAPAELENQEFDYEYQSPVIKAQRQQELLAFNATMQSLAPLLAERPELLDVYDGDSLIRDNSQIAGIPQKHMRSQAEVAQIAAARQQAQQQAAQQEQAMQVADTAANLQKSGINVTDE